VHSLGLVGHHNTLICGLALPPAQKKQKTTWKNDSRLRVMRLSDTTQVSNNIAI
jgi:hypothetical protein